MAAKLFREKIKENDFQYLIRWVKYQTKQKQTFQLDDWDAKSRMSIFSTVAACFTGLKEGDLVSRAEVRELLVLLMSECNVFTFLDLLNVLKTNDTSIINHFIATLIKKNHFMVLDESELSTIEAKRKEMPMLESFLSLSQMAGSTWEGSREMNQADLLSYEVMACVLVQLVHMHRKDPRAEPVAGILERATLGLANKKDCLDYSGLFHSLARLTEPNLRIAARYIFSPTVNEKEKGSDLSCLFSHQVTSLAKKVLG